MAVLNDTVIHGFLNIKNNITITEDDINLVFAEDDSLYLGDINYNINIKNKNFESISANNTIFFSKRNHDIITESGDINLISNNGLIDLNANTIKLKDSRTLYGTQDPNDMDLSNISEGTLYFRVLND